MANFSSLKQAIQNYIKENGNKEITGNLLQEILLSMVVTMGDNAINSLTTVVNELNTILHSVDAEPTKNSVNLVRSGGVWSGINREALRAFNAETFEARFNSTNNRVEFFNQSGDMLYWYDASAFVTTGFVKDVYIENDNLVFVINTSAGEKTIEVPLEDVFNPNNYYTKTQIDDIVRTIRELYDGAEYRGFITPSSQAESKQGVKMVCFATEAGTYTNFLANYDTPIVIPVRGIWVFERGVDADDWTAYSLLEIDKVYAPAQASGMGRVVLQKNMVNGVNTLTQDMFYKGEVGSRVPNTNTIFVIEYDFILGEDITVPANCVLEFDGGSISGAYTLTGNNTDINAGIIKILGTDITLDGTWNVAEAYPEWFGAVGDGVTDDTAAIQKVLNYFKYVAFTGEKTYEVTSPITCNNRVLDGKAVYGHLPKIETNVAGITMFVSNGSEFRGLDLRHKNNSNETSRILKVASGDYIHDCFIMGGYDSIYCDTTCDILVIDRCFCWNSSGHAWLYLNVSNNYLAAGVKITNCHLNFQNSLDDESMKYGLMLYRCEQSVIENCIINQADINIWENECREINHNNIHTERNGLPSQLTKAESSLSVSVGDYLYNDRAYGIIYKVLSAGTINTLTGWSDEIGSTFTVDGVSIKAYKYSCCLYLTRSKQAVFSGFKFCNLCSGFIAGTSTFIGCEDYSVVAQGLYLNNQQYNVTFIGCTLNYDVKLQYENQGKVNYINTRINGSIPLTNMIVGAESYTTINSSTTIDLSSIKNENTKYLVDASSGNINIRIPNTGKYQAKLLTFVRIDDTGNEVSLDTIYAPSDGRYSAVLHTIDDSITIRTSNIDNNHLNVAGYGENIAKRRGATSNRPSLSFMSKGFLYYDTDIKELMLWDGTAWVKSAGAASEVITTISQDTTLDLDTIQGDTKFYIDASAGRVTVRIPPTSTKNKYKLTFIRIDDSAHLAGLLTLYSPSDYRYGTVIHTKYDTVTVSLGNLDDNVLKVLSYGENQYKRKGTTSNRPALHSNSKGFMYFDTDLSPARPIYWNGSAWVDATGATV